MNKRGLQIKTSLFAIVSFSIIIIAIGVIGSEWSNNYGSGLNYDLSEYQALNELSEESQLQRGKITPNDPEPGSGDFEGKIFRGGYGILGSIFQPFNSVFNMLESIEDRFGLPSYIVEGILTMIFFGIIFALISVIFRLSRSA
jgi:hypothetical protein